MLKLCLIMCFWCGPLCIHLVWGSMCFLDLYIYFLHLVRAVSVIIFYHRFSIPCCLLLLAPTRYECWYACSCPRGSIYYPHFLDSFFFLLF
uniref:Uncharacterized protein n=1 Tax=Desmodus rotundus TaxID=9430 RepID=K9IW42_DESRO